MSVDLLSTIPVVDLSPFFASGNANDRKKAVQDFTHACRRLGFVTVVGHGVSSEWLSEAFLWSKKLFDLSYEDKMKAPHPPCNIPHRGYSPSGLEKVYSKAERQQEEATRTGGKSLEKVKDYKLTRKSYEIGSEENPAQPNIWVPESVLPGFREFMTSFYWELTSVSKTIIQVIGEGLNLTEDEKKLIAHQHSGHNNQLRLLHYPPVCAKALETQRVARMPAHSDWSSFTLLFQDDCGGLELKNPGELGTFITAKPVPESLVLNIGDMFQRMTNNTFISAMHRVVLPPVADKFTPNLTRKGMAPARYSIPFFVAPDDDAQVACLPSMVRDSRPANYEPVVFSEYGDWISKYQYERGPGDEA